MDGHFISGQFLINSNFRVAPSLLNPPLPHSCGATNMLILLFRHPVNKNLSSGLRKTVRMKQHLVWMMLIISIPVDYLHAVVML